MTETPGAPAPPPVDAVAESPIDPARRRRISADRRLEAAKARYTASRTALEAVSQAVANATGSTPFLIVHLVWFAVWIGVNSPVAGMEAFDPYPFGLLTMIVSLEAICLSIFILMAQNRDAEIAELRAEVTLEVNLRVEEEVTKALQLITGLYRRLNLPLAEDAELRQMLQPLDAVGIERELSTQIHPRQTPPKRR